MDSGCGGRASGWEQGGAGQRVRAGGPVGGGSGCGGRASGWGQWVRGAGQWVGAVGAGGGPVGADGKGWGGELWRGNAGVRCSKAARGCALNASQGDCPGRTVSLGSPPPPSPAPTPPSLLPPDRLPAKVVCPAHFSPLPLRGKRLQGDAHALFDRLSHWYRSQSHKKLGHERSDSSDSGLEPREVDCGRIV